MICGRLATAFRSFKCKGIQALFEGERLKRWVNIERPALRKLELTLRT